MPLPNVIMAGTGRSGSTSLFRYLSDHPEVCASSVKETGFFIAHKHDAREALPAYEAYFSHCPNDASVIVEATPQYLIWGREVAPVISALLPGVKLLFIFRKPAERLVTVYRNLSGKKHEKLADLSFGEFAELALDGAGNDHPEALSDLQQRATFLLNANCYAEHLRYYYDHFPADRICVLFHDDLKKDIRQTMKVVSEFVAIDPGFYDAYSFTIKNKTRAFRSKRVHQTAVSLKKMLKPVLSRSHDLRGRLRELYLRFNEDKDGAPEIPSEIQSRLADYFVPHNEALYRLLKEHHPELVFPAWLKPSSEVT